MVEIIENIWPTSSRKINSQKEIQRWLKYENSCQGLKVATTDMTTYSKKNMNSIRKLKKKKHKTKLSQTPRDDHILSVLRNSLAGINCRLDIEVQNISDLEDIVLEAINWNRERKRLEKKNELSFIVCEIVSSDLTFMNLSLKTRNEKKQREKKN